MALYGHLPHAALVGILLRSPPQRGTKVATHVRMAYVGVLQAHTPAPSPQGASEAKLVGEWAHACMCTHMCGYLRTRKKTLRNYSNNFFLPHAPHAHSMESGVACFAADAIICHIERSEMLEILAIFATLFLLNLANKPRGRSRRRYSLRRVRVTPELPLLTLGSDTAIVTGVTGAGTTDYRVISIKVVWALKSFTAGQGPITVGYCHSDYTVTEIKECLESAASIAQGLKIEQERANRLVRVVGTLGGEANTRLNDGRPIKTRLNWLMAEGGGNALNIFAFNEATGALTTGSVLTIVGDMYVQDG